MLSLNCTELSPRLNDSAGGRKLRAYFRKIKRPGNGSLVKSALFEKKKILNINEA